MTKSLSALLAAAALFVGGAAQAQQEPIERDICVFDIAGQMGPTMAAMKDWRAAALKWGLKANLRVYTNEQVAAEDLKAGQCDASLITGLRARQFNKYAGTLDSIGALPSMEHMKLALRVLAHPSRAEQLTANSYEVIGIAPSAPPTCSSTTGKSIPWPRPPARRWRCWISTPPRPRWWPPPAPPRCPRTSPTSPASSTTAPWT
ncbi:hypothetical protein ASALC70_04120 [Alcanivorax sp. ALC70]|nr:hypothetical protein ASALC70_04120 [Alcanivorax sp. ALC70]